MKKFHCQTVLVLTVLLLILLTGLSAGEAEAADPETYLVTIENLTSSQPMSPVVAAASVRGFVMFMTGKKASAEMEALAENGDNAPLLALLGASSKVVDFTSAGGPLLPGESVSFELEAKPEDNLSLAAMLICTNDGFTGLDRARFPQGGPVTYKLVAYDARTETNTELSADLPDECALGAPDDNQSPPPERNRAIKKHPGVNGTVGDLTPAHDWTEPVARVTIKRLANTLPLRTAVTVDGVRAHQQALQEIANANGGVRFASSPGYDASVDYVANKLREAGYKVEIGNFEFPFFQELADPVLEQVTPNPATYPP
ncbi:MAG TPA: spondin domain-containing protein, partial [Anaerolineae bacterium]|nr:spondin domain-containing protein [Anaerolineae bacterium]